MSATENKALLTMVFAALAAGDDRPFLDAMAVDMRWVWMGSGQWSRSFDGKDSVVNGLWAAVRQTLKPPYRVRMERIIADDDYAVVEACGENSTPDGRPYENRYCWVCRLQDGKIREIREYMDTELVTRTFGEG